MTEYKDISFSDIEMFKVGPHVSKELINVKFIMQLVDKWKM